LCLAAASWSFEHAAANLKEFCGLSVCGQTIRAVCHDEAGLMADWLHTDAAVGRAFATADGEVEFQTDGTMVNTTADGWREMRLGVFAKRKPGRAAKPKAWAKRRLPAPSCRVIFAGVQTAATFGPRIRAWAGRLSIQDPSEVTVLADGADWIWKAAAEQLPGSGGVLDIFHAIEHIAGCGREVFGEGSAQARTWTDRGREMLLAGGAEGIANLITQTRRTRRGGKRAALDGLARYFGRQSKHLGYACRLAEGKSIGSGLVEGACKQVIGRRLKQTGARWTIRRVNRMATLCCTFHCDTWDNYWKLTLN
jgi:hypothetical protein